MADPKNTSELVEFMVRQAADGEMPLQVLSFSLNKLYEAEIQKNNVVTQQPEAIVQPPVIAEPQSAVSQTPSAQVIDDQQKLKEKEAFGKPSQGATSQQQPVQPAQSQGAASQQQPVPPAQSQGAASQQQQPVQPAQSQGAASQQQQPVQPAQSQGAASQQQPVQPAQSQGAASQQQQPVQPAQSQGAASQQQQPLQPAQSQGAASQQQPVQPAATGPQANAQALNNIDPNDIRLQRLQNMEPKSLQILKKKVITKEQRLKLKFATAAKVRKFIYTLVTILATIFCAHGVNGYLETFVEFCRGTFEGLATYTAASAIMGVGLMFIAYAKEKAFNKPKFEKFNFLRGLQNFMNAEGIRKKLDYTTESKGLIEAEEARRASI
jgi:hypothetical protein